MWFLKAVHVVTPVSWTRHNEKQPLAKLLTPIDGLQSAWIIDAHEVFTQAQDRTILAMQGFVLVVEPAMANAIKIIQVGESGREGTWQFAKGREEGH